ncbi:MAG: mechanosensitive ion channel family protein [Prevotellaceae bacterium]|jgi:small-conductance mechanosensitive channel|nr:mechanosensitive ion channel family protein [Prevotellaceae bacterium]
MKTYSCLLWCFALLALPLLPAKALELPEDKGLPSDNLPLNKEVVSAPVVLFGDTAFFLYLDVGGVTVKRRAKVVTENILELADDLLFKADSLVVHASEGFYSVVYKSKVLIGVSDKQGYAAEKSSKALAEEYRDAIATAIIREQSKNVWYILLKQVLFTLVIIAALYFGIKYLNILFRRLQIFTQRRRKERTIKALYSLMDADKQAAFIVAALKVLKYVLIAIACYVCLLALFRLFPSTQWLSDTLVGYITAPLKVIFFAAWGYLPHLFAVIIIVALFRLAFKALRIVAGKIGAGAIAFKGFQPEWAKPTYQIVRVVLVVFLLIFIFPHLPNYDSEAFKGVSVLMGVLLSLGSTAVVGNVVAGLVITYMNSFRVGDRIKMGEHTGNVVEKTALVTRIRTPKNEVVTIPNSSIMAAQTINFTASAKEYGLILHTKVTMGYEVDWRRVHALLIEAGLKTSHVLRDPAPFVLQTALDDFYVSYQINVYTAEADEMIGIYSSLHQNVQDVFNREGIDLVLPHVVAVRGPGAEGTAK